jgi:uncharacterized membrane protein YccC
MQWLRDHDPGLIALHRAARAAIVMPSLFFISDKVIANPAVATFAAFGSFALLVLVEFAGTIRERVEAQIALALVGALFVAVGTLASRSTALAAVAMAVVAFGVLFAGVISSVIASATTSLLLAFILPVSIPGTASSIPDRLAGWGMASVVSVFAISLLWPAPVRNPLRAAASRACRALAARLRADVAYARRTMPAEDREKAIAAADEAVDSLRDLFFATQYRPTGLSTSARALVRLVDELRWLNTLVLHGGRRKLVEREERRLAGDVKLAAAQTLEDGADLVDEPHSDPQTLSDAHERLLATLAAMEEHTTQRLPRGNGDGDGAEVVSALDPSFRAQELSFVVAQIATNIQFAAAADRRSMVDRLLGRQPRGLSTTIAAAQERAVSHTATRSVWLQNSVRGAVGLGLAVWVSRASGVGHAFWVVLGALSVLRSNALNTGQTVVRGLVGTSIGFLIGALVVQVVGTDTTLLWFLLPLSVLLAAAAPATIGFEAGQAAFTLTILILFNILQPEGWRIGLVRVEDVALGCAVSLLVGLLFWPRGATSALGRALADAYAESARYLARAVDYGMSRCDDSQRPVEAPLGDALQAAGAARRLDDTFRTFLAERGEKPAALADVTSLVTGVAGVRLAGDAVLDLWRGADDADGDRTAARRELLAGAERVSDWYSSFGSSLIGRGAVPEPLEPDTVADGRLVDAVSHDLASEDGVASATGVRMIWTGDHLDAVRRLQAMLVQPARAAAGGEAAHTGS